MAGDLNRVTIIARLTREPEIKHLQSGSAICNFSVANNKVYFTSSGDKKEEVNYFDCIAWGKQGEFIAEYAKKGKRIAIDGKLKQDRWDDKDGGKRSKISIVCESVQLLDFSKAEDGEAASEQPDTNVGQSCDNPFSEENIPF